GSGSCGDKLLHLFGEGGKTHVFCLNLFLDLVLNTQLLGLKWVRNGVKCLIDSLDGVNVVGDPRSSHIKLFEGMAHF
uniref:Uncharacterized protein n=1 Tax=Romanomermis culicivorax TaxID=13658 RepID=A0A915JBX5_ROMCU